MPLNLNERQLRLALANVPLPMLAHDETGRIRYLSDAFLRTTGYRSEDLQTHEQWLALAYDDPAVLARIRAVLREGYQRPEALPSAWELSVRMADGSKRLWAVSTFSIGSDDEGRVVVVSVAIDVTNEREVVAALARSEARLRLTLQIGEVGTFDWDLVAGVLTWDERIRQIWGVDFDRKMTEADVYASLHPDDRELVRAARAASHDPSGDGAYAAEYRVVNPKDGLTRSVSTRGRTFFENGRPVRMIGAVVETTALREAAVVLERDRAELEKLVEARTRDLAEAQTRLAHAQRMEALGQLAGGVAHDFNNVLQAVEAAADLIERRPDPLNLPRYLKMAREATKRGAAISRRLTSMSRRAELEAERVETARLLDDVAGVLRRTFEAAIAIDVDCPDDVPDLMADRRLLETSLINLAANAREAMAGAGSLTLRARAEDASEAMTSRYQAQLSPGAYVRVEIVDSGAGMNGEVLARAVEPFFSTKPRGQGAGLGLSMARGFADQSGGGLRIVSAPAQGAAVALWLPVAAAVRSAESPTPVEAAGRGQLMLVDDDPLVRELIGEQLRVAGYDVTVCEEGSSAIRHIESGATVDLLLTDFAMPEMNGVALAREARKRRPDLPIVILTGYASEAAEAAGEDELALLRKPIDREALIGRVAALIGTA